ncbi:MAG: glycosyltransferase [Vampirovibrionales bacterium]|nr:glycosyltransferase [Vampirovibrionales bacterium]
MSAFTHLSNDTDQRAKNRLDSATSLTPEVPPTFDEFSGRVYFSVSAEGLGHSTRAIAMAHQFDPSRILIGSYDYVLERIRAFGLPCVEVKQEIKLIGEGGTFDVGKTILQNQSFALQFNQMIQDEMELMRQHGITAVVADGRLAPMLAASRLDIPCLVVTNQSAFYPFFNHDSPLVKWFGQSFDWAMTQWLCSAEEILIPDFPPPHTVSLYNLSSQAQVKKRTRFIGPLVDFRRPKAVEHVAQPLDLSSRGFKYRVAVSMGGHEYRRPLFEAVQAVARLMPEVAFDVLSSLSLSIHCANVFLYPNVVQSMPFFTAADCVITQAGHSTAMELLSLGKPSVIVPDAKQMEQENNAKRLVEMGVALMLEYDTLTPEALKQVLEQVLYKPQFANEAARFAAMADKLQGVRQAANLLTHYARRLTCY